MLTEITYLDVVSPDDTQKFIDYKYSGADDSLLYQYFISPLCQYLTDNHVPTWLAPNTITVIGFGLNVFAHLVICVLFDEVQTWMFLLQGIIMFIYSVGEIFTSDS